jgi:hypothetical protein
MAESGNVQDFDELRNRHALFGSLIYRITPLTIISSVPASR